MDLLQQVYFQQTKFHRTSFTGTTRSNATFLMTSNDELDEVVARLEAIADELGDKAIELLRESLESGDHDLAADERRITKARRAVEKAVGILSGNHS